MSNRLKVLVYLKVRGKVTDLIFCYYVTIQMFSHSNRRYIIYPSGLLGNVSQDCFCLVLMQPSTVRSVTTDKLRPPREHKSPFKRTEESNFSSSSDLCCESGQRWRFLFALSSAAKWPLLLVFLYHIIVRTGWVREALLLSEASLKAVFCVHSPPSC